MEEHAPQRDADGPVVELSAVRAENPGPMTLSGTNSYVLRDGEQMWVIDPGPRDPEHLAEL
ncbi:MAG: MBL fold metallo-hydrolase, partial [Dermabacteraceae bacterium]